MGSPVSAAWKLSLSLGSKNEKHLTPLPVRQKPDTDNGGDRTVADLAVKAQRSPPRFSDAGGKDEAFFDSQPWLESDGEDDFLSVNGDINPSSGSTPIHHKFSTVKPPPGRQDPVVEGTTPGSVPRPPHSDKKNSLSELFKGSSPEHPYAGKENAASDESLVTEKVKVEASSRVQPKCTNSSPCFFRSISGRSGERTHNRLLGSAPCCLPRLLKSRSITGRKKKTSPAHSMG